MYNELFVNPVSFIVVICTCSVEDPNEEKKSIYKCGRVKKGECQGNNGNAKNVEVL